MSSTLRQFIETRLAELAQLEEPLRAKMAELQSEIDRIEAERAEISTALNAIEGKALQDPHVTRRNYPNMTIKNAVLTVLQNAPDGLTALEILDRINVLMNSAFPRTSLSPQLTRLKSDGLISLNDGNVWKLGSNKSGTSISSIELFG